MADQDKSPLTAPPAGTLLPITELAMNVRALYDSPDLGVRRRRGFDLRDRISVFIVNQLKAMPAISRRQLQDQLRAIGSECSPTEDCDESQRPSVFTTGWGPASERRHVVVAYALDLRMYSPGGAITAIESYLWERDGNARLAARGGGEFDDYHVNFESVAWWPDGEYWVLAWGGTRGASGRGIGGRAAVYRVRTDAVSVVWSRSRMVNVNARKNELGWQFSYHDPSRLYGGLPQPRIGWTMRRGRMQG